MKRPPLVARCAMFLSLAGLTFYPTVGARAEALLGVDGRLSVADVVLDSENLLHGQLLNASAAPAQGQLLLLKDGQSLGRLSTGADGRFAVRLSQGGTYQLATADRVTTIRVWTRRAAPPSAQQQLVLVQGDVFRGQRGRIHYSSISPWVVAGVVAVAIGVPIVLANHRQDRGNGS